MKVVFVVWICCSFILDDPDKAKYRIKKREAKA